MPADPDLIETWLLQKSIVNGLEFGVDPLTGNQDTPISAAQYIGVFKQDFHLRSQTKCFVNSAYHSERGLVEAFSWF